MKVYFSNLCLCISLFFAGCDAGSSDWNYVGPAQITGIPGPPNLPGLAPCAGKIDAITVSDNYNGNGGEAMYVVGPGSGIWRSTDFSNDQPTWQCLTDHIPISNNPVTDNMLRQSINDICSIVVDPSNKQRIYAGTNSSKSVILYSKDGGDNWSVISSSSFGNTYGVTHLFVTPDGVLYVLLNSSFWRQDSPGSTSFINLGSPVTESMSPLSLRPYINFQDAVYTTDPSGQLDQIYVAIVEQNDPTAAHTGIWSFKNGIWAQMPIGMVNLQGLPFFNADIKRIRMSANPQTGVVAAMTSDNGLLRNLQGSFLNVFKLLYNSKSKKFYWEAQWQSPTVSFGTQSTNFDMGTCIDHNGIIYSGGVGLAQSDGERGVVNITPHGACNNCNLHTDENVIIEYNNNIYVGTDGGLIRFNSGDYTGGDHDIVSMNSPSLQNFLSTSVDKNIYEGTFLVGNHDVALSFVSSSGSQYSNFSNENEFARFVPFVVGTPDKQIAYSFDPRNGFYKSADGGRTFTGINLKIPPADTKFCFKKTEKGRMLLTVEVTEQINGLNTLQHTVFETKDDWTTSKNIMAILKNVGTVSALCYAGDHILVATGKKVLESSDDGNTWNISWTTDAKIVAICSDQADPNNIYLATSGPNNIPGKVFHCSLPVDNAEAWAVDDLTGDIPGVITNFNILSRGPTKWPYLFASLKNQDPIFGIGGPGLYKGIVGKHKQVRWNKLGNKLPDSEIQDIQVIPIDAGTGTVLVATYGRGAWQINLTDGN